MFKLLSNLFGKGTVKSPKVYGDERDLSSFILYVASSLVDNPSSVSVSTADKNNGLIINIKCRKEDIGKLIGKNGKTIEAMRALVSSAGGRVGKHVRVEIIE